jgi:hypothetical protein
MAGRSMANGSMRRGAVVVLLAGGLVVGAGMPSLAATPLGRKPGVSPGIGVSLPLTPRPGEGGGSSSTSGANELMAAYRGSTTMWPSKLIRPVLPSRAGSRHGPYAFAMRFVFTAYVLLITLRRSFPPPSAQCLVDASINLYSTRWRHKTIPRYEARHTSVYSSSVTVLNGTRHKELRTAGQLSHLRSIELMFYTRQCSDGDQPAHPAAGEPRGCVRPVHLRRSRPLFCAGRGGNALSLRSGVGNTRNHRLNAQS